MRGGSGCASRFRRTGGRLGGMLLEQFTLYIVFETICLKNSKRIRKRASAYAAAEYFNFFKVKMLQGLPPPAEHHHRENGMNEMTPLERATAIAQGREILLATKDSTNRKNEDFWENTDLSEFQALLRAFERAAALNFDPQACSQHGIHAMASREAARSADQFLRLCQRHGLHFSDQLASPEALAKTILAGFSDHVGCETGGGSRVYNLTGGNRGHLAKDAHIKPPRLLVASEITEIQGKALQVQLGNCIEAASWQGSRMGFFGL